MIHYAFADRPLILNNAKKADPQKIGEALAKIAGANQGLLAPEVVVKAAENPRNALHQHFEWDDAKAANAYRLSQARTIIRLIATEDVEGDAVPAFYSISDKGGRAYRSYAEVKESPRLQRLILESARRDLEAFQRRYRQLVHLFEPYISKAKELLSEQ